MNHLEIKCPTLKSKLEKSIKIDDEFKGCCFTNDGNSSSNSSGYSLVPWNVFDLSVSPCARYASFPYHDYTPFAQFISIDDLIEKELKLKQPLIEKSCLMNQSCDVSSSCNGVCIVTRNVILSNSHAGTHADQPKHFEKEPIVEQFHSLQYNGSCLILNLVEELKANFEISLEMIRNAIERTQIPKEKILRCIIKTRSSQPRDEQEWTNDFAHFNPSAAEFLSKELTNLLLVGIDTPSIDHPNKAPIIEHSHGQFWKSRIAILENLNCEMICSNNESFIEGYLQTSFNPLQISQDAIGCFVKFYPTTINNNL